MSVNVPKVVAYAVQGPPQGVAVSKVVAYVVMQPGSEEGATPPVHRAFSYAQRVRDIS